MHSLFIGQCIEGMAVSGLISDRSFKLERCIDKECIIILIQFSDMLHCWL